MNDFRIPFCRLEIVKSQIRYKGVELWNMINSTISHNCSLFTFKRKIKKYLMNNHYFIQENVNSIMMLWKFYISVTLYPYFPVVVIIICQSFIYCYIIFAVLYFCYKKPIHIECVSFFFCIGDYYVIVILFISFCGTPIKFNSIQFKVP